MIEKIALLLVACLTVVAVRVITGSGPIEILRYYFGRLVGALSGHSAKTREKNRVALGQMTAKEKKKNKKYRFLSFLSEILLDMGWDGKGITVEGINTLLQAITVFIAGLVWITMNSFLLALVVAPVFYATLVALLFLFSRMNHSRRKQALMDAEDIICANMGQGTVVAIETNIGSFDPFVVPVFKQFLDEVYNRNASVEAALNSLNANCGEIFDNFCDKAKAYERERRPGMENLFQYNINHNAEIRNLDRECAKAFTAMNRNYLLSLAIIAGFVIYTIVTYDGVAHFYSSGFGRFLITLYAVASAIVFIYIQYIQSKPFIYGTRGVVPDTSAARKYEDETYNRTRQTRWVADKLEPLADRCRRILQKKHSEVTDEDLEALQRYSDEMRKAQDEEGEEMVGNG